MASMLSLTSRTAVRIGNRRVPSAAVRVGLVTRPLSTTRAVQNKDIDLSLKALRQSQEEKRRASDAVSPATTNPRSKVLETFSLKDKVAVVTGGARGLGNTFARAFLESGCTRLAILDLNQEDARTAATQLTELFGGEVDVKGWAVDVSKEESVQIALQEVVDEWGKIDTLVASAGIVENFPAIEYPASKVRKLFDINVHGAFFSAREAAKHMIKTGTEGSIILVASMSASIVNYPQLQTPYNASKAAVRHMASSLAVEWARHNIRVNALSPGYMLTALTKAILEKDQELKRTWESLTPMKRMGNPEDLKGAIVYLASDASKFTTGTELRVDGGYTVL